jgi:hypothetical protein
MPDSADAFRKAASDCLYLARTTSDLGTRAALLTMAQRWFDLANGSSQATLDAAMRSFNDGQMAPTTVVQQQQQAQPERTTKKK